MRASAVLLIVTTGCWCSAPAQAPTVNVPEGECLLAFDNRSNVLGMDGASSIPLDGERTLFVFADTLTGTWKSDGTRNTTGMQDSSAFVASRAAARDCFRGITFSGGAKAARVFTGGETGRSIWPNHGRAEGTALTLFYFAAKKVEDGGSDFTLHSGVATGTVDPVAVDATNAAKGGEKEPLLGSALLLHGELAYVYRCNGGTVLGTGFYPCVVGRTSPASIGDPSTYRYFVKDKGYVGALSEATFALEGASEFTVTFNAHLGRFVQIYIEPFGTEVIGKTAPAPEGPFGPKKVLRKCWIPEGDPQAGCYAGKEHPELGSADGKLLAVTYNTNGDFWKLSGQPALYWPRLFHVDAEALR